MVHRYLTQSPSLVKLVRLEQIIAAGLNMTSNSAKVKSLALGMCEEFGLK